ncbi:MAG: 23S rRNA (pseudouridine(1915)-N(3))-methyltransferase RlmH [Oscillospiraceae bacterium]|jgi:23S rRNA (pseudouridine1915-N3)-methyltransferase|nr:23S rRNA (pseudouridine(1915)-N(3))-methyltransferase RlmH [Oscillospiraceae bacterium]
MTGVTLLCAGRVKEKYYEQAAGEYIKRLGAYCDLSVVEIRELASLQKEAPELLTRIPKGAYVIALCVEGREMSTRELADTLSGLSQSHSRLCVVIGSSNGLHDDVKNAADLRLSLSRMTLPHSLARVFALEQLYRAYNIISGGKYHK